MRIAYIFNWVLSGSGIDDKVRRQIASWRNGGVGVELFYLCSGDGQHLKDCVWIKRENARSVVGQYLDNRKCFSRLELALRSYKPDVVYLRNCYYHPRLGTILRSYPSVLELNSLWLQEAWLHRKASLKRRLLYYHLLATRKLMYKAVKGAVAVTHEIRDLELHKCLPDLPVEVVPNSIEMPQRREATTYKKRSSNLPKIVFAAGPLPIRAEENYHGIDKIYRFASNTVGRFTFVLIGDNQFYPERKPSNIQLTGKLNHDEMRKVIGECDIGLGTAALHRKGMEEACPLKVREYIAQGLPVILPYKDTAFWRRVPPWVLEIPNCEDNLDAASEEIEEFCRKLSGRRVPNEEANEYIGASTVERARIGFLERMYTDNQDHRTSI